MRDPTDRSIRDACCRQSRPAVFGPATSPTDASDATTLCAPAWSVSSLHDAAPVGQGPAAHRRSGAARQRLRRPRVAGLVPGPAPTPMQLPMWGFYTLGVINYPLMGVVLRRAVRSGDARAYRLAVAVLACGELWNAVFFGRRSARVGSPGCWPCVPLGLLQVAVAHDRVSALVLAPYTAWVVGYDLPWTTSSGSSTRHHPRRWSHRPTAPNLDKTEPLSPPARPGLLIAIPCIVLDTRRGTPAEQEILRCPICRACR